MAKRYHKKRWHRPVKRIDLSEYEAMTDEHGQPVTDWMHRQIYRDKRGCKFVLLNSHHQLWDWDTKPRVILGTAKNCACGLAVETFSFMRKFFKGTKDKSPL